MDITNTIAIYGRSGHGKVLADIARAKGFKKILWIDDDPKKEALSFLEFYEFYHEVPVLLGIGDNSTRQKLYQSLKSKGFSLPCIVHPSATVSESVELMDATVVMPHVVINADTTIGIGCIINSSAVIEHDCRIKDFVHISVNASLAGNVEVSRFSHIGINATIIQGICIGENVKLGAGAVVINNLESNVTAVGVPAKALP